MFKYLSFCLLLASSLCAGGVKTAYKGDNFIAEVWQNEDGSYSFQVYGHDFLDSFKHVYRFENPEHSLSCPCQFYND